MNIYNTTIMQKRQKTGHINWAAISKLKVLSQSDWAIKLVDTKSQFHAL